MVRTLLMRNGREWAVSGRQWVLVMIYSIIRRLQFMSCSSCNEWNDYWKLCFIPRVSIENDVRNTIIQIPLVKFPGILILILSIYSNRFPSKSNTRAIRKLCSVKWFMYQQLKQSKCKLEWSNDLCVLWRGGAQHCDTSRRPWFMESHVFVKSLPSWLLYASSTVQPICYTKLNNGLDGFILLLDKSPQNGGL